MSADLDARDRHGLPPRVEAPATEQIDLLRACREIERERAAMEGERDRLRELNAELLAALKAITSASDSDDASGGEMWWTEAVYPHVEAAKAVISKAERSAATAPLFAPGPQSHDTNVICPHCGHAYEAQAEDCDESSREIECDGCGTTFTVRAEISITYHTKP